MKNLFVYVLASACILCGCKKDEPDLENLKVPRLMVESRGIDYGGMRGTTVQMPVSGTSIALQKEPLVNEFQIANVELVKVEMGLALLVQLNELGSRALYRGTVTNMGQRIVLTVNGNPIGARRIDGAIQNGNFYTFVEIDDEEVGQLVIDLKDSIEKLKHLGE